MHNLILALLVVYRQTTPARLGLATIQAGHDVASLHVTLSSQTTADEAVTVAFLLITSGFEHEFSE